MPISSSTRVRLTSAALALCLASACFGGGGGGGGGGVGLNEGGGAETENAEETLNNTVGLPPGSYQADPDSAGTDPSVVVDGMGSGSSSTDAGPGDVITLSTSFTAPNGNVAGAGIRFGDSGPAWVVPIPTDGMTSGTMSFQIQIPPGICDNLSQICHDIKCYEFAVTTAGTFSAANIMDLALACNNCDEPSCQSLLQSCMGGGCGTTTEAGDDLPYSGTIELGQPSGTFDVSYDMQTQKDQIIVRYEGAVLFDSGCVSGADTVPLTYSGTATSVQVEVNPNCEGGSGTAWEFSVGCPT